MDGFSCGYTRRLAIDQNLFCHHLGFIVNWLVRMYREVRSKFISLREEDFVLSARLIASEVRVIFGSHDSLRL